MWPYAKSVPAPSHGPGSDISIGPFLALPKGVAEQAAAYSQRCYA